MEAVFNPIAKIREELSLENGFLQDFDVLVQPWSQLLQEIQ